jgi:hypothetical protein
LLSASFWLLSNLRCLLIVQIYIQARPSRVNSKRSCPTMGKR